VDLAAEPARLTDDRLLTEIAGDDVLTLVRSELERSGVAYTQQPAPPDLWLHADGHAIARVLVHLATRLQEVVGAGRLSLVLAPAGRQAQLDARWRGRAPLTSVVDSWLDEPLDGAGTATAREVADRHGAEIWCGDLETGNAYLRMLLPLSAETGRPGAPLSPAETTSRPEFYDFDLFTARPQPADLADRRLDETAFTVFDTETTGLDPASGDRIVSIGAVRVVNGRVLRQETFERLVHPGRSVPAASTAFHGITEEMVAGQPTIEEVLPAFARFCEDTVLVGHNVSFDLQFLEMAAPSAGVELTQPALDTLLLHAALHPDHEDHTLEGIAGRLGISVVGRHTALGDALVTAEIFVGLTALLHRRGIDTLGATLGASRATFRARVDERRYRS
jgi:DNA polymerase-3 subunit epsilon